MPTYEYGCEACGKKWELEQRITEAPVRKCPKCKKLKARRLISGGHFMLKGGGWYADGYGSSKKANGGSSEAETKGESATKKSESSGKSESASKSEAKSTSGAAD